MNEFITIRRATLEDAAQLGVLGPAAYAGAYAYLWDKPDAYAHQLETFGRSAFEVLLKRTDAYVWVADYKGMLVGFLSMIIGSLDPVTRRAGGAELPRIYILNPACGMGIGERLLNAAIKQARDEKLSYIWLDVMASADWAQRTYAKWGFRNIGTTIFSKPTKEDMRDMIVMVRDLA